MNSYDTRKKPVRVLASIGFCLVLLCVLAYQTFGPFEWLHALKSIAGAIPTPTPDPVAVTEHFAVDVLGQLTGDDEPDFNHNEENNSPNSRGFYAGGSLALDTVNHRLFVGEYYGFRILVFNLDVNNVLVDRRADFALGVPDFRTSGGGCSINGVSAIGGLAYDPTTNLLYAGEQFGTRIMVFDVTTITTGEDAVHVLGQDDTVGPNAGDLDFFNDCTPGTTQSVVDNVSGMSLDVAGQRLFAVDMNNSRVLVFDVATITDGEPAINELGQPDDGNPYDSKFEAVSQTGMAIPNGAHFDPVAQRLFVADRQNSRMLVFDLSSGITNGMPAAFELGQPNDADPFDSNSAASGAGGMANPSESTWDEVGQRLFVSDSNNNRVLVFDLSGGITNGMDASFELGQEDDGTPFDSAVAAVSQSGLNGAEGIAFDPTTNHLYVADDNNNNRVMVFDVDTVTNGENAVNLLGQLDENDEPVYTVKNPDNAPNAQGMGPATGVALDSVHHRLFTSDWGNHRVMVFNLDDQNRPLDHTADFILGQPDFKTMASGTNDFTFNRPQGISYDASDDLLFVADSGNGRILVFDTATITTGESAVHVVGKPDFNTGGAGLSDSELACPQGVSIEPFNGVLAVGDTCNNRALLFDLGGPGLPSLADGMAASRVFGEPDYDTSACALGPDAMCNPNGVYLETITDSLWVSDNGNNRILRFDTSTPSSGPAGNVLGQPDFVTNTAATTQSGMSNPWGASIIESDDATRRLFVSDSGNSRVLVFDISGAISDGMDAVDAYGQPDFSSGTCNQGGASAANTLCNPIASDYDEDTDTLLVADDNNTRVLLFVPPPTPTPPSGGGGGTPSGVGFTPLRIEVNRDDEETDSKNVLVTIFAQNTSSFAGTVDVLLSNTPDFSTFVPFRYSIPGPGNQQNIWPKTVAWDLCFGLTKTSSCGLGNKTVYARFLVNIPAPTQVLGQ